MESEYNEAYAAALHWGRPENPPRLISARENLVFEVSYPGFRAALRLHRPQYQSAASIRSELDLTKALAAEGFPVPGPIATLKGQLLVPVGTRLASLVHWCDGSQFGRRDTPIKDAAKAMHRLGRSIATLHNTLDGLTLPKDFSRPKWDAEGLLGEAPLWGRFWEGPALTTAERQELLTFRAAATQALDPQQDYGLIHADLLRENILQSPIGLTLIDFDDCGFGFRLYDLAVALVQSLDDPDLAEQIAALFAGYAALRPLPEMARASLTLFLALRLCASIGWLAARVAAEDPGHRLRTDRALRIVRLWQQGGRL